MSGGYSKRGLNISGPSVGPNTRIEQFAFRNGIRHDLSAREMPLDATPDMENIRLEQNSLRQDFGFEQIGEATQYEVLGIAEHRYILSNKEYQRIVRVTRNFEGFLVLQTWNGTEWLNSVPTNIPISSRPMSMVSTQNKFVFTNGGEIMVWEEPEPGLIIIRQNYPHPTLRPVERNGGSRYSRVTRLDRIAASSTHQIDVAYGMRLRFTPYYDPKVPPLANGGYTIRVVVKLEHSYDGENYHLSGTQKHEHTFDHLGTNVTEQKHDISPTPTLAVSVPKALNVTHLRFSIIEAKMITDNPIQNYVYNWGFTLFSRADTDYPPGLEYRTYEDAGGTVEFLNAADAPQATFIAPFGDRLLALRDVGDPQRLSASADGNIVVWAGVDTYAASLLDTVHDPIDPLQALAFLSDNQAALLRSRNIMRVSETENPNLPIAVNPWIEGIGTESPFTVVQARDGIMFLGHNLMVYYWDGGGPPVPVGLPIHNELLGSLAGGLSTLTAAFDPIWEEYWLLTPDDTWIFELRSFLDIQQLIWRRRADVYDRAAVVREF